MPARCCHKRTFEATGARRSAMPPGAKPTITRTGLLGKDWDSPGGAAIVSATAMKVSRSARRDILPPGMVSYLTETVTRRKFAGIDVVFWSALLFWLANSVSSSFCSSAARPSFSAASKAFIVGP